MLHGGDGLELLLIAAIALVVVGPKDLPILLRKLGQFVGKMRGMAAEFRASFDEMARQSELDELRKEVEAMRQGQFADQAARATGTEEVNQIFHEIGDSLGEVQLHPPMSHQYDAAAMVASSEPMVETVTPPQAPVAETPKATPAKATTPKATATKTTTAKATATKTIAASSPKAKPARSAPARPMTVKPAARVKAAPVAHPTRAKAIAKPKAPVKPTSAKAAKTVVAPVPRAPVQRARTAAKPKAGTIK